MALLTEPAYVLPKPASRLASIGRPTPIELEPDALAAINFTLDEILQLWVHASFFIDAPEHPNAARQLGPDERYSVEQFKLGVPRVVGTVLGTAATVEADAIVRDASLDALAVPQSNGVPAGNGFPATAPASITEQANEIFVSLREWIHSIAELGATGSPPHGSEHSSSAPPGTSPKVTFQTALYAERCIVSVARHLLRIVGNETALGPVRMASIIDVENGFKNDPTIWSWLSSMRVRTHIENQATALRSRTTKVDPASSSSGAFPRRGSTQGLAEAVSASSVNSPSSLTLVNSRDRLAPISGGLGTGGPRVLADDFEQLMLSGKTRKVSLTPDRLRTVDTGPLVRSVAGGLSPAAGVDQGHRRSQSRNALLTDVNDEAQETLLDPEEVSRTISTPTSAHVIRRRSISEAEVLADPLAPMSVAMRLQGSQDSMQSSSSSASSDPGPEPSARLPKLKAKDQRRDLAHERQINHDLAEFFSNAPPPRKASGPAAALYPTTMDPFPVSPKKSRNGLSSLFSRKKRDSDTTDNGGLSRVESISSRTVPGSVSGASLSSRNSTHDASAAALRAAGFSDTAARAATYAPPPLLAGLPRSSSPVNSITPTRSTFTQQQSPGTNARSSQSIRSLAQSDVQPVSILRNGSFSNSPMSSRAPTSAPIPPSLGAEPSARRSREPSLVGSLTSGHRASQERPRRSSARLSESGSSFKGSPVPSAIDPALAAGVGMGAVAAGAVAAAALGSGNGSHHSRTNSAASSSRRSIGGRSPRVGGGSGGSPLLGGGSPRMTGTASPSRGFRERERTASYASALSRTSELADSPTSHPSSLLPPAPIDGDDGQRATAAAASEGPEFSNQEQASVSLPELLKLRSRMAAATSVDECLALLDAVLVPSVKGSSGPALPAEEAVDAVNSFIGPEPTAKASEGERGQATMAEFFLGGADDVVEGRRKSFVPSHEVTLRPNATEDMLVLEDQTGVQMNEQRVVDPDEQDVVAPAAVLTG